MGPVATAPQPRASIPDIRSIFEYGCVAFLHVPDTTLDILQKVQNKALRISLPLPKYISLKLLHENACLPTIKERFQQLGSRIMEKMRRNNPLVRDIIQQKEAENLKIVIQQGQNTTIRPHRSPLDILLPAQRPFLTSS